MRTVSSTTATGMQQMTGTEAAAGRATTAPLLAMGIAAASLVLAILPVFLVSGLAVQIRAELGFSETALGLAVSGAFVVAACVGPIAGRLADRFGPRATLVLSASVSMAVLTGLATLTQGWLSLALILLVSGAALASTTPGISILLARLVPRERQGLAFGIKEASIPIATLVAGLAIPAVALTVGWRWAFTLGLLPLVGVALMLPRVPHTSATGRARDVTTVAWRPPPAALAAVAVAGAFGNGAAAGVAVFLTQSAVALGMSPAGAGYLLAGGSVAGIITRLAMGLVADHRGGAQFGMIAAMLAIGAVTMSFGAGGTVGLLIVGTVGAFSAGWGWAGLLFLSMIRVLPGSPGAATGIGVAGLATGNGLGPLIFGTLAEQASYRTAWIVASAMAATGALVLHLVRRGLREPDAT